MIVDKGERATIGSKAFDLYRCKLLDVNVPDFFVVPTSFFRKYNSNEIEFLLHKHLKEVFEELGGSVAVRSSSVAEDLEKSSMAGRFKTILGVESLSGLVSAIQKVRSSADGSDMAVLIQKQLKPDISGVLFTRNPVNGNDETVLEYVRGLGDKLVSGTSAPVRVKLKKNKSSKIFDELIEISTKLEQHFGYPLDIEWARCGGIFYILQARPITNLPPPDKTAGRTYSRVQAEQFYSGPTSPLFFDFFNYLYSKYYIQETIDTVGLKLKLDDVMVRHKNYLFVDTAFAQYAIKNLPVREGRKLLLEAFPEDLKDELRNSKPKIMSIEVMRILKFIMANPRFWKSNLDNHFRNRVVPEIIARIEELNDFEKMTLSELEEAYEKLMETAILHIRTSKWGLALYLVPTIGAMNRFLAKTGLDKGHLPNLMSGLSVNKTLEASMELKKLARIITAEPVLIKIFQKPLSDYSAYRNELIKTPKGELIIDYFESILTRFGHRRLSRDLMTPSWRDEPEIPFFILKKMVCDGKIDSTDIKITSMEKRIQTENEIKKALPVIKKWRFSRLSRYLLRYVTFREYQRFYLDMIISKMRELIMEISKRMVKDSVIKQEDDVFFLEIADLREFLARVHNPDLHKKSEFNRLSFENSSGAPGRYLRAGIDFDSVSQPKQHELRSAAPKKVIMGEPVSPGFFSGPVRIIENIDSSTELEKNDIVVTRCIDPGQTHVFMLAGALVFESGGILSHGAILAREFNLPTVAGIKNATDIFKNNQRIAVNGSTGEICVGKG
ncbi:MAG: hypothetical protein JSV49_00495 [Thermoplasmata archaeon]|nr:MAG: hypothetical protein JSV49_00495 [Thermoplasmata archaeon]